jgi:hypothetical protein
MHAVAVELDLMRPAVACGRLIAQKGELMSATSLVGKPVLSFGMTS